MKILVVANETAESVTLRRHVARLAAGADAQVLVVAPALIGRLDFWATDDRRARSAAGRRLDECLAALGDAGVDAGGYVGDSDPLQAIEDALSVFEADEIVISTDPEGSSNWLARKVVARARLRFASRSTTSSQRAHRIAS
ncbi:MAG: hypothetical protein ABI990_04145 [Actinomycetota bacterium]